jgi:hypothetical protein
MDLEKTYCLTFLACCRKRPVSWLPTTSRLLDFPTYVRWQDKAPHLTSFGYKKIQKKGGIDILLLVYSPCGPNFSIFLSFYLHFLSARFLPWYELREANVHGFLCTDEVPAILEL